MAFDLSLQIINERFDPSQYNVYIFYASDGDNFAADREPTQTLLARLSKLCSFMGYVETLGRNGTGLNTEMGRLFKELAARDVPADSYPIGGQEDVWKAIRQFFTHQARQGED